MRSLRGCCRPGCNRSAVATLTYVYSDSTAVVGPLATVDEPHSWDLCEVHASTTTAPKGWELVRYEGGFAAATSPDEDDLTALAEAVREAGRGERTNTPAVQGGRRDGGTESGAASERRNAPPVRTGRRGHLRVLPDPSS